jgi:hypothetical protein
MGLSVAEQIAASGRLGLSWSGVSVFSKMHEFTPAPLAGEFLLRFERGSDDKRFGIERFRAVCRGVTVAGRDTGRLDVSKPTGTGSLAPTPEGRWSLRAEITAEVHYRAIPLRERFTPLGTDIFISPREVFGGIIEVELAERSAPDLDELWIESGSIAFNAIRTVLGYVEAIQIPLGETRVRIPPAAPLDCPAGSWVDRRQLRLRPVGFKIDAKDPQPTGMTWAKQLAGVREVWGRCCLDFTEETLHEIVDGTLKSSSSADAVWACWDDPVGAVIDVFFVDNDLSGGGGFTFDPDKSSAAVVISDHNMLNPYLLAHEMGHVLGGLHPRDPAQYGFWVADAQTVLEWTGSLNIANPSANTWNNCRRTDNPAFSTVPGECCLGNRS